MIHDLISTLAKQHAVALESNMFNTLRALGYDTSEPKILASRCQILRFPSGVETLCCDGKPVMEWHPIEMKMDGNKMTVTQKYRTFR